MTNNEGQTTGRKARHEQRMTDHGELAATSGQCNSFAEFRGFPRHITFETQHCWAIHRVVFPDRDGGYSVYEGLMVSVSGVRGRVGEALSPEVVTRFAAGFGAWAKAKWSAGPRASGRCRVVVGRDSRVSGPMFHRATIAALQS